MRKLKVFFTYVYVVNQFACIIRYVPPLAYFRKAGA